MAKGPRYPVTQAVRALRQAKAQYTPHLYDYVERGGTAASSAALGVHEHAVIKTLVFVDEHAKPLVVLMHGDRQVAAGTLARTLGVRKVRAAAPAVAEQHSGYRVGGTSPFGLRKAMPIFAEGSIGELERLFINGGKRGFLVELSGAELTRVLAPTWVNVASDGSV